MMLRSERLALFLVAVLCTSYSAAQTKPGSTGTASSANLQGVYQAIPDGVTLPGGMRNSGSPSTITLLPEAAKQVTSSDLRKDPRKLCQPIGPFRMMAEDRVKFEIAQVNYMIVFLFEDLSHGLMRSVYLKRDHPGKIEPTWMGDSVGRWESETLVIDTKGFNGNTWLNDNGAQHTDALHLAERIRPVLGGQYLEYKMTAEDAGALAKPYTYTRYFQKLETEIEDDPCEYAE